MSELRELYQAVILDHNKTPRNFGDLTGANREAKGYNPLCGDRIHLQALVEGEVVKDLRFTGSGCAISRASASLMTQSVKGRSLAEVEELFGGFHALVTSDPKQPADDASLGKLAVLGGVREFPMRVKCATLAWHTLRSALDQRGQVAKTE